MNRSYNFSAGPAMLPLVVLARAQKELLEWNAGMSVMEVSHRGAAFMALVASCEERLRLLLRIPANYKVLFMQGGASAQFAAVPLNLLGDRKTVDYIDTGVWSQKAISEARRYANVNVAASAKEANYTTVPLQSAWKLSADAAYLHITPNETIQGVEYHQFPQGFDRVLVADMSSTLLSRPVDVTQFGLIYAGVQKNIGPAGLTIVIVREDLLNKASALTPSILNYSLQAPEHSLYNTPPTFIWYMVNLVLEWLVEQGGLAAMAAVNERKATALYDAIDSSAFYKNTVDKAYRSWMNIPFTLAQDKRDGLFLEEAEKVGLMNLKGHRMVGGMRASLYNAMPEEGVRNLIGFMQDFERRYG